MVQDGLRTSLFGLVEAASHGTCTKHIALHLDITVPAPISLGDEGVARAALLMFCKVCYTQLVSKTDRQMRK